MRELQTDYIDLLRIHRHYPVCHIEKTLGALSDFVRQGKVRYAGCSTFLAWKLVHALMLSKMKQCVRFVNEESPYNLLDRRIENELVPLAMEHGVDLLAWSPSAHGMLVGAPTNMNTNSLRAHVQAVESPSMRIASRQRVSKLAARSLRSLNLLRQRR